MGTSNIIAAIALVVAGLALLVSIFAARYTYRNALAAERQATAAEKSLPPPIEWESEFGSRLGSVRLRNIGTEDAHDVRIELPERRFRILDNQFRQPPGDVAIDVQAGQSIELEIYTAGGIQDIREIPVLWRGQERAVLVPMPRRQPRRQRR